MGIIEDEEGKLRKHIDEQKSKLEAAVQQLGAEHKVGEAKKIKLNSGEASKQGSAEFETAQNNIEAAALVVEDAKAQLGLTEALLEGCIQKQKLKAAMELAQQSTKKREASRGQAAEAESSQHSGEPQP